MNKEQKSLKTRLKYMPIPLVVACALMFVSVFTPNFIEIYFNALNVPLSDTAFFVPNSIIGWVKPEASALTYKITWGVFLSCFILFALTVAYYVRKYDW